MTETTETIDTTTKFTGDIIFNNGDKDIKASELTTKSELTTTLTDYRKYDDNTIINYKYYGITTDEQGRCRINDWKWGDGDPIWFTFEYNNNQYTVKTGDTQPFRYLKSSHPDDDVPNDILSISLNYYHEPDTSKTIDSYYATLLYSNFDETYAKITKAWQESEDELVLKSELPKIDKLSDVEARHDMTGYEASDDSLMSSAAIMNLLSTQLNTTITHYCPIEAGEDINRYDIGKPVFLSGHVYKYFNDKFVSSTATDTTDCICSVVINGTWKEYVGIVTSIDIKNKCITFASNGDYLFYVDDSNIYQIGDVVLYDGRIVDEDYAITLKISQSIVGKITAKLNEHFVALFKE